LQAPDANEKVSHHFVAFVHKDGNLYELGKLKCMDIGDGYKSVFEWLRIVLEHRTALMLVGQPALRSWV
jgi:hypothetical protein